jgi:hypothetical protein
LHKSGSFSSCVSALRAAVDLGVGTAGLQYSREQGAPRPGVGSPPPLESRLVNAGARSPKIGGGQQPRRRFNDGVSAEPRRVVSFSKESAHSDGSVQLANDSVTPVAGRYISQYDIKARRRRQTESVQAHTGGDAGATDERWASGSLAGSWAQKHWAYGNERQSNQAAWRAERRQSSMRPLASQPPDKRSAAAWRAEPLFDADTRSKVREVAAAAGTTESFVAQQVPPAGAEPAERRRQRRQRLDLRPTQSMADLAETVAQELGLPSSPQPQGIGRRSRQQVPRPSSRQGVATATPVPRAVAAGAPRVREAAGGGKGAGHKHTAATDSGRDWSSSEESERSSTKSREQPHSRYNIKAAARLSGPSWGV